MKRDKNFVSDLDKLLVNKAKEFEASESQKEEIKKFERIIKLRDNKQKSDKT